MNKVIRKGRKPETSVVIPVYNCAPYLKECLNSILNQTYQDFEIVIVDDCSNDGSLKILQDYKAKHKKIRLFRNRNNKGVSITAKKAIGFARGDYIARMDADDIMLPLRLEKQISYLKKNKKTVAVGAQALIVDAKNNVIGEKKFPTAFEDIYKYIFKFIPVQQATMTIAKNRLPEDFNYYRDGMNTAEEVELFFKLFQHGKVENLDSILLLYRHHATNTSLKSIKRTFFLTLIARLRALITYRYKPTFSGLLFTLAQSFVILILPQRITLPLYKTIREGSSRRFPAVIKDYKSPRYSI